MYLGVDYYPEQWSKNLVEADLENIIELGSNMIRIGEFAWCRMEKTEGDYDFSLFDEVILKAKEKNLNIMFGTPTATLPAWLATKYPEVLSEFSNGRKRSFGGRRNYCFNSDVYIEYSKKIITKLVNHYKDEETIKVWQIDNEFGHEDSDICYCDNCRKKFQNFLEKKYKNIKILNEVYGTIFWSQEYTEFLEIPLPLPTITTHNPSLRMDWEIFRSKSIEDYCSLQVEIIKSIIPNAVVTHDFSGGGLVKHLDMSEVAKPIDVVSYNNYPVWGGQKEPIPPYETAFNLSYMRGLKQKNFWITEAIMGAQGHDITGYLPRPNQAKMWSYQGVAHGCSSLLYFRYRSATRGAEQFCYGILDADNVKRRKFYEVQSFFTDIKKYKEIIESPIENEICIVTDYKSMASFRIQQQSIYLDYDKELKKIYKPFHDKNIGVDIIPMSSDFSKYKVAIVPLMIVWEKSFQERIKKFTKEGGIVLFTCRTAVKDINNNLTFGKVLPTNYDELIGGIIFETESLQSYDSIPLKGRGEFSEKEGSAGIFREFIEPTTAKTLYTYNDKFYDTYSAITENQYGKGRAIYMGTFLVEKDFENIVDYILNLSNIKGINSPLGVEIVTRTTKEGKYQFIMNHTDEEKEMKGYKLLPYESIVIKV